MHTFTHAQLDKFLDRGDYETILHHLHRSTIAGRHLIAISEHEGWVLSATTREFLLSGVSVAYACFVRDGIPCEAPADAERIRGLACRLVDSVLT